MAGSSSYDAMESDFHNANGPVIAASAMLATTLEECYLSGASLLILSKALGIFVGMVGLLIV